eukprot:7194462-Pyramimonas_sp.AAC.1
MSDVAMAAGCLQTTSQKVAWPVSRCQSHLHDMSGVVSCERPDHPAMVPWRAAAVGCRRQGRLSVVRGMHEGSRRRIIHPFQNGQWPCVNGYP